MAVPGSAAALLLSSVGGDEGYTIERSLRFDPSSSSYLSRIPSSVGNRKTWTWSGWVKRSKLNTWQMLLAAGETGADRTYIAFVGSDTPPYADQLTVGHLASGIVTGAVYFNLKLRDCSAFYHLCVSADLTNATPNDRVKAYINGVEVAATVDNAFENTDLQINNTVTHQTKHAANSSLFVDGYLADVHFIDGQALDCNSFGETNAFGIWQAKEFTGTYGPIVKQTRVWSNDLSATSLANATKMFDWTYGYGSYSGTCTWTTTNSAYSGLSGRVYLANNTTVTIGVTFKDSGGNTLGSFNLPWTGNGTALQDTGFDWSSSVASVEFTGGYLPVRVHIGSSILVDTGVSISSNGFHLKFADSSSNAALGTDSSPNNNDFTVHNLTAAANGVTSFSSTNVTNVSNILDGNTSTGAVFTSTNAVFDAVCNISGITQLEFLLYDGSGDNKGQMQYRVNGGSYVNASYNNTNTYVWNNATSLLTNGTLTSFGFKLSGASNGGAKAARYTTSAGTFYITSTPASNIDSLIDTPTNYESATGGNNGGNYAVLNPLIYPASTYLSDGNLKLSATTTSYVQATSTIGMNSGRWYWEVLFEGTNTLIGVTSNPNSGSYVGQVAGSYGRDQGGGYYNNGVNGSGFTSWTSGTTVGVALDMDNGTVTLYFNGNPESTFATGLDTSKTFYAAFSVHGSTSKNIINFGQRQFLHAIPTGFKSLCTTNLNQPTIPDPSTAFDIALWPATGTAFKLGGPAFSSLLTASGSGFRSGNPAAKAFDGTDSNAVTNDNNGTITFNATGLGLSGAVRVRFGTGNAGTYTATFVGSGGTQTDSQSLGASQAGAWTSSYNVGTLTSISVTTTSGSQMNLMQIEVDGTVLIDGDGKPFAFSPDIFWSKSRSTTYNHGIHDTVRGPNKLLRADTDGSEYTAASPNESITSFNSDGVTFGPDGAAATVNYTGTYVGWAWDVGNNSNRTYTVTVVSDSGANKYRFDGHGTSAVTLDLEEGSTYVFDSSDDSVDGHPFVLGTSANSNPYSTGVTYTLDGVEKTYSQYTSGFASATTRKLTITIPASAPTLHYFCHFHSGMGGQINTNSTAGATVLSGSLNSSVYNTSDKWSDDVAGSTYLGAGMPKSKLFNGVLDNNVIAQSGTSLTFTPSGLSSISSLRFYGSSYTQNANGIVINGTDYTSSFPQGGNAVAAWVTIPETSLTSVVWSTQSNGYENGSLFAIEVDGKMLVDNDQTPPNVPSVNTLVRSSPSTGCSIVSYLGNSAVSTLAHGLNNQPQFVVLKNRDKSASGYRWYVQHVGIGLGSGRLSLDDPFASSTSNATNYWNATAPTNHVVHLGASNLVNNSGDEHIMYCFAPVPQFSKIGSWIGNSSTSGPYIECGFSPRYVLFKRSNSGDDWTIFDTARDTNPLNIGLNPNNNNNEQVYGNRSIEVKANGFRVTSTGGSSNANNAPYIFVAFAEKCFSLNGGLAR